MKRQNRVEGQFSQRLIEMLESPAWRVASLLCRRVVERIEIELANHGGKDNGDLVVTKQDFVDYGICHLYVARALREAEALGFIHVKRGRGGNADERKPNRFLLTFSRRREDPTYNPPHDWRKIKTIEEAETIAAAARQAKDQRATLLGHNRRRCHLATKSGPEKTENQATKSGLGPGHKMRPETAISPGHKKWPTI